MKCIDCDSEATFVSPKNWCSKHWAFWWTEGLTKGLKISKKEKDKLLKEILEEIKKGDD